MRRKTVIRQAKVLEARMEGKTFQEAGIAAGYSPKGAAVQAIKVIGKDVDVKKAFVQILEEEGLTDNFLGRKAKELMQAKQTIYAQKDGVFTDSRDVEALETQRKTWETVNKLKGHLKDQSSGDVNIGLMQMIVQAVQSPGTDDE
jgi:phage terminase small subunit